MGELLGSRGAEEISVFQADEAGNGTNPLRLPSSPKVIPAQAETPADTVTATDADPDLVESCVEVAVMIAVSAPVLGGVKVIPVPELTPVVELNVPPADGLMERFTVFVNAPVPVTVGVQVVV